MANTAPHGSVRVANEVIASIAAMAAAEIDGVAGLDSAAARQIGDWLKLRTAHHGVRVLVDQEQSIHLDVFITVASGVRLPQAAANVQDNVVEAVERMLGLRVAEANVYVSAVSFTG